MRRSPSSPTRARKFYGIQFHPEVVHTPHGAALLRNFMHGIAGLQPATGRWRAFRDEAITKIRAQVGKGRVICGLSGGVDSSVAAVLIHEAIGDQLTCVFVDHGLLRLNEARARSSPCSATTTTFRWSTWTRERCFSASSTGVTDPEAKRKTIGRLFIDVFERGGGEDRAARRSSWRRARSIPT